MRAKSARLEDHACRGFLVHINSFSQRCHHPNARKSGAPWGPRFRAGL